jgi:hypothetical protein
MQGRSGDVVMLGLAGFVVLSVTEVQRRPGRSSIRRSVRGCRYPSERARQRADAWVRRASRCLPWPEIWVWVGMR